MTGLRWAMALCGLALLAACAPVTPTAGVSVGSGGVGAGVGPGLSSGRGDVAEGGVGVVLP